MPIADLTLDTNVLLHSCNPIEIRHTAALKFITDLLASTTHLAIDDGFHPDAAKNRSLIGGEYLEKLVPGTFPSQVLIQMALAGRISIFADSVDAQAAKKLNQLVANKRDRTFVKVCSNSSGRLFVSHDFDDFPKKKRKALGELFNIEIEESNVCGCRL